MSKFARNARSRSAGSRRRDVALLGRAALLQPCRRAGERSWKRRTGSRLTGHGRIGEEVSSRNLPGVQAGGRAAVEPRTTRRITTWVSPTRNGLLDEALGEFQIAAKDPRGVSAAACSLCFVEKGLPQLHPVVPEGPGSPGSLPRRAGDRYDLPPHEDNGEREGLRSTSRSTGKHELPRSADRVKSLENALDLTVPLGTDLSLEGLSSIWTSAGAFPSEDIDLECGRAGGRARRRAAGARPLAVDCEFCCRRGRRRRARFAWETSS